MGYKIGTFLYKYLGIELEKGSKTNKGWHSILERMDKKIGGWKDKWLTKVGKTTKIRVVLSSLPTILYLVFLQLKNTYKKFENKFRKFLWNDSADSNKLALIKWDNICKPNELGGLGIKKLSC